MTTIRPHGQVLAFSEWTMPRPVPTTPGLRFRVQACGTSRSLTFQIGVCGSLDQRPLPDRPPTLQAFRSIHRETPSVSTRRLSMALVPTPAAARFNPGERCVVYHIRHTAVNREQAKAVKIHRLSARFSAWKRGQSLSDSAARIPGLEFTHFLSDEVRLTPINKG